MTAADVLARLAAAGVELRLEGDRLRYSCPAGALTADLRKAVAEHRSAIVARLRAHAPGRCGSCDWPADVILDGAGLCTACRLADPDRVGVPPGLDGDALARWIHAGDPAPATPAGRAGAGVLAAKRRGLALACAAMYRRIDALRPGAWNLDRLAEWAPHLADGIRRAELAADAVYAAFLVGAADEVAVGKALAQVERAYVAAAAELAVIDPVPGARRRGGAA